MRLMKLSDKWLEGFLTVVDGWCEGTKWGLFAPLYSLAGPQNRTYFDLSDSF